MRRETLINALSRIRNDLIECELAELFQMFIDSRRATKEDGPIPSSLFISFQKYTEKTSAYSSVEDYVLDVLELKDLKSSEWWHRFATSPEPSIYWIMSNHVNFAINHIPKLIKLFHQKGVEEAVSAENLTAINREDLESFSVILIEDENENSRPERLIQCLSSVSLMYSSISEIKSINSGGLTVLSCDSGSDKSFDFLGIADVVREIRRCFAGIFTYRLLNRQVQVSANIELVAQALPVISEIETMRQNGALTGEQADRLRHNLLKGASQFLECGAVTSDMDDQLAVPRLVMRPEPKLLSGPVAPESGEGSHGKVDTGDTSNSREQLTDAELQRMRELLAAAEQSSDARPRRKSTVRKRGQLR